MQVDWISRRVRKPQSGCLWSFETPHETASRYVEIAIHMSVQVRTKYAITCMASCGERRYVVLSLSYHVASSRRSSIERE